MLYCFIQSFWILSTFYCFNLKRFLLFLICKLTVSRYMFKIVKHLISTQHRNTRCMLFSCELYTYRSMGIFVR